MRPEDLPAWLAEQRATTPGGGVAVAVCPVCDERLPRRMSEADLAAPEAALEAVDQQIRLHVATHTTEDFLRVILDLQRRLAVAKVAVACMTDHVAELTSAVTL